MFVSKIFSLTIDNKNVTRHWLEYENTPISREIKRVSILLMEIKVFSFLVSMSCMASCMRTVFFASIFARGVRYNISLLHLMPRGLWKTGFASPPNLSIKDATWFFLLVSCHQGFCERGDIILGFLIDIWLGKYYSEFFWNSDSTATSSLFTEILWHTTYSVYSKGRI